MSLPEGGEGAVPVTDIQAEDSKIEMPSLEQLDGSGAMVTEAFKSRDEKIFQLQKEAKERDQRILELEQMVQRMMSEQTKIGLSSAKSFDEENRDHMVKVGYPGVGKTPEEDKPTE